MDNKTNKRKPRRTKFFVNIDEGRRWTAKEKKLLLRALQKYGHLDISNIQSEIPGRSHASIRTVIAHWKKEAKSKLCKKKWSRRNVNTEKLVEEYNTPKLDLTEKWIEVFKALLKDKANIIYGLANVFLVIAELGDFPSPSICDGVDFREVYLCMHSILNGHPCKDISSKSAAFMFDCFHRMEGLSDELGQEMEKRLLKEFFNCEVPKSDNKCDTKNTPKPHTDAEPIEKMLEVVDTNPLKIPTELLIKETKKKN